MASSKEFSVSATWRCKLDQRIAQDLVAEANIVQAEVPLNQRLGQIGGQLAMHHLSEKLSDLAGIDVFLGEICEGVVEHISYGVMWNVVKSINTPENSEVIIQVTHIANSSQNLKPLVICQILADLSEMVCEGWLSIEAQRHILNDLSKYASPEGFLAIPRKLFSSLVELPKYIANSRSHCKSSGDDYNCGEALV